jgi:hypothetical protein
LREREVGERAGHLELGEGEGVRALGKAGPARHQSRFAQEASRNGWPGGQGQTAVAEWVAGEPATRCRRRPHAAGAGHTLQAPSRKNRSGRGWRRSAAARLVPARVGR